MNETTRRSWGFFRQTHLSLLDKQGHVETGVGHTPTYLHSLGRVGAQTEISCFTLRPSCLQMNPNLMPALRLIVPALAGEAALPLTGRSSCTNLDSTFVTLIERSEKTLNVLIKAL